MNKSFYQAQRIYPNYTHVNALSQDFCEKQSDQLSNRYTFTSKLMKVTDEAEFHQDCLFYVKMMELDMWFDPMAGFAVIKDEQSCKQ